MTLDTKQVETYVNKEFEEHIIPTLCEYIKIPNLSPSFDDEWATNGLQDKAIDLLMKWAEKHKCPELKMEKITLEGKTPIIFMELEATKEGAGTVLLYGHMDKQPPSEGWEEGLGPYTPVIRDGKLYGRGGADDGYSIFSVVTAINALKLQKIPHGRCVVIIEACEESGSPDLPYYIGALKERIGTPNFVICLDSGSGNYEQMWLTTSLRGIIVGELKVQMLKDGVHSGVGSGIIPDTFRISRMLLSRLEDEKTGEILPKEFHVEIPEQRIQQAKTCAEILQEAIFSEFSFSEKAKPVTNDNTQLILNRTWRPQLSIVGANGLPETQQAGNVLRAFTTLKVSMRVPPKLDAKKAAEKLKELFEKDPPYGAKVTFTINNSASGWESPALEDWVEKTVQKASKSFYGKQCAFIGEGGTIPFMGMLGAQFPKAQFCITGVLGPGSNAHGPNEFLHIDYTKKLTACVVSILADHANVKA